MKSHIELFSRTELMCGSSVYVHYTAQSVELKVSHVHELGI